MLVSVDKDSLLIRDDSVTLVAKDGESVIVKKDGVEIVDEEAKRREILDLKEKCENLNQFWGSLASSKIKEVFSEIS